MLGFFLVTTGFAQDMAELQKQLGDRFLGKILTLRGFYSDDRVRFDGKGNPIGPPHPGSWTTSSLEINEVKVSKTKVELKGTRWVEAFDQNQMKLVPVRTSREMRVDIARDLSMNDDALIETIQRIFLKADEHLTELVPDYWKSYFSSYEIVPQSDGSKCVRISNSFTRGPYGDVWQPCEKEATTKTTPTAPVNVEALPYSVRDGVKAPMAVFSPDPEYSPIAGREGVQGIVIVQLVVRPDGSPSEIQIVRPAGLGLDEKAVEAVRRWKFKPGTLNGKPVSVAVQVEVSFQSH